MGKLIWNKNGGLAEVIGSQTSFITGANLKKKDKKPVKKKPNKKDKG